MRNSKDHQALETICDNLTLAKNFIKSGNWTTTLADEMKQEYFKTFDHLLTEFDRWFTDNLSVVIRLEALDPSSTKFMDTAAQAFLFSLWQAGYQQHSS